MISTRLDRLTTAFSRAVTRIGFWELFAIALVIRLPLVIMRPPAELSENLNAGLTLARHGFLGDPFCLPTGPTAHVAPAYPALVALVRVLTPSDAVCLRLLSLILAVVSSCNIAALIPVARRLGLPRGSGLVAAAIWLIPLFPWIEFSARHETPLTVAALLAFVTLMTRTVQQPAPTAGSAARLGLLTGVAAYCTPTVLPVAVCTFFAGCPWRQWRLSGVLKVTAIAGIAFAIVVAPYTVRNHQALGAWFFMRDNLGIELAMSNGPGTQAVADDNFTVLNQQHPFVSKTAALEVRQLGEVAFNHRLQERALGWIRTHPGAFLSLTLKRAGYLVLPKSARWYQSVIASLVSLAAIGGAVLLWRSPYRLGVRCLAAALFGYLWIYLLVQHDIRYLYPALLLESLLGASLAVVMLGRFARPATPAAA
jgi:hypothetical protein